MDGGQQVSRLLSSAPPGWPRLGQILGLGLFLVFLPLTRAADLIPIDLATAGPGNLSHLPVDLIPRIGADRAEGVELRVRYFAGGPLAYRDLLDGNSDFAVAGMPALAALWLQGAPVVSIAAVNQVPTFVLMVRADLKEEIKGLADLRGRVIGLNTSTAGVRSTSQQIAEYLLQGAGIDPKREVSFLPAGQTLADQMAAIDSGVVDALMGDEPFATLLQQQGRVFYLLDLHDPKRTRDLFGGLWLNAQLATRRDVLEMQPDKAARMVRILKRTLEWIAQHEPAEILAALEIGEDKEALLEALNRHRDIYSPDGSFSTEQIATTERFLRVSLAMPPEADMSLQQLIDPQYAGIRTPQDPNR